MHASKGASQSHAGLLLWDVLPRAQRSAWDQAWRRAEVRRLGKFVPVHVQGRGWHVSSAVRRTHQSNQMPL